MCMKKEGILKQLDIQKVKKFKEFYSTAKKVRGKHFNSFVSSKITTSDLPTLCFAVVASKKGVDKRAVNRNRAKRRLKAAFNLSLKQLAEASSGSELKSGTLVFMANRSAVSCDWGELQKEVYLGVARFFNENSGK